MTASQQPSTDTATENHPLRFTWVFWYMRRIPGQRNTGDKEAYENNIKKIASVASVEEFWAVYSHLKRASTLQSVTDYHVFRKGVKPVWEDEYNVNGGKWIIRLKKGISSRLWEELVMALMGDQFDVGAEICGIVLSIRLHEDIISVWNASAGKARGNLHIRDTMKRLLNLPANTIMEYKAHDTSIRDQSSFRNADRVYHPPSQIHTNTPSSYQPPQPSPSSYHNPPPQQS